MLTYGYWWTKLVVPSIGSTMNVGVCGTRDGVEVPVEVDGT